MTQTKPQVEIRSAGKGAIFIAFKEIASLYTGPLASRGAGRGTKIRRTTDMHLDEQVYNTVMIDDIDGFVRLLAAHPGAEKHPDGRSRWLTHAAHWGALRIAQHLVESGADVNQPSHDEEDAPEGALYGAVMQGHLDTARWLLDRGAAVNHVVRGRMRCFALSTAARNGDLDMVKLLVERGAAVNSPWSKKTPFDHALLGTKAEVATYLRSVGAKTAKELG